MLIETFDLFSSMCNIVHIEIIEMELNTETRTN